MASRASLRCRGIGLGARGVDGLLEGRLAGVAEVRVVGVDLLGTQVHGDALGVWDVLLEFLARGSSAAVSSLALGKRCNG